MRKLMSILALGVAVFGGLCANYTYGEGFVEHTAWAVSHQLPKPSYPIFLMGMGLVAIGCAVFGWLAGRRR